MSETPDNNQGAPSSEELLASAFERLSSERKVEVFGELIYLLYEDLSTKFNDPVLTDSADLLDTLHSNISSRLEEIAAIYGQQG